MTNEELILAKRHYYLGRLYENGTRNIDCDIEAAIENYEKSAALGYPPAIFQVGMSYYYCYRDDEPDYKKAFEYFLLSGTDDGDFWIGRCYHYGFGVKQSYPKAISIYEKLVKRGYTYAMMTLGHMYRGGIGVEKDQEMAAKYYLLAAEGGNDAGYLHIAVSYKHGFGIEQDLEKADFWFKKWRENAKEDIDEDSFYNERAPEEYDEAMDLFGTLADQGDVECLRILRAEGIRKI